jgi:hypothetical protein
VTKMLNPVPRSDAMPGREHRVNLSAL